MSHARGWAAAEDDEEVDRTWHIKCGNCRKRHHSVNQVFRCHLKRWKNSPPTTEQLKLLNTMRHERGIGPVTEGTYEYRNMSMADASEEITHYALRETEEERDADAERWYESQYLSFR